MAVREDPVAAFFAKAAEVAAEVGQRGGGLADIRQKLVEEPWFGRATSAQREPSMAESLGWETPGERTPEQAWDALCGQLEKERGHQPERAVEHDHEVDR